MNEINECFTASQNSMPPAVINLTRTSTHIISTPTGPLKIVMYYSSHLNKYFSVIIEPTRKNKI